MYHKPRKPPQTKTPLPRPTKPLKRSKRPRQIGKRGTELSDWVRDIARPYLVEKYGGEHCNVLGCYATGRMDVDHILNKGSRPDLKMSLHNVQFLCRDHHRMKTGGIVLVYRYDRAYLYPMP